MGDLAGRLASFPTIKLFGAPIPVSNYIVHVFDEYGVVGEIEKPRLLALHFAELADPPYQPRDCERSEKKCDQSEPILHVPHPKRENRLEEEIVEAAGDHQREEEIRNEGCQQCEHK